MFRRRASGAALRRVGLSCAVALTGLTAVAPTVAEAQGPGTGKRVMLYTGTTQLREASIAVAAPVIQGKLEELDGMGSVEQVSRAIDAALEGDAA